MGWWDNAINNSLRWISCNMLQSWKTMLRYVSGWFMVIYIDLPNFFRTSKSSKVPQFPAVSRSCSWVSSTLALQPWPSAEGEALPILRPTNKRLLKSPEVSIFGLVLRENLQENMAFLPSNLSVPAIFPFCQSNDSSTSGISTVQKLRRGPQVKTHILPDSRHSRITVQF